MISRYDYVLTCLYVNFSSSAVTLSRKKGTKERLRYTVCFSDVYFYVSTLCLDLNLFIVIDISKRNILSPVIIHRTSPKFTEYNDVVEVVNDLLETILK